ncbi:MAG: ABC transporter ATP-binding protein [Candidatus Bathyarchaeota archaeon]|nr:ABC transporter ATP-binding protein [Candidatus Bathyarchaeota archaeon]
MAVAIDVRELTKCYPKVLAVDHISFKVLKGEFFGFLGPNGAGKTTTINILTGTSNATSGQAYILGGNLTQKPMQVKEHIGVVPDASNLYGEISAWNNLMFCAKIHGVKKEKRQEKAAMLLKSVGLFERRDERVDTFSRGMKKRLMIAAALIHDPKILFLDEPTTGLDVQSARDVRALIRELNRQGVTVFLTTHYLEEADQCCARIAIISNGNIIAIDTPERLKLMAQAEQVIEVSFDGAADLTQKLQKLDYVKGVAVAGDKFRLLTDDTSMVLPTIVRFAQENHLRIISINTPKPTLEAAFVRLTGLHPEILSAEGKTEQNQR